MSHLYGRGGSVLVIKVSFGYRLFFRLFLKSVRFFGSVGEISDFFSYCEVRTCRSICSASMLKQRLLSIVVSAGYVTIPIHKQRKLNENYNNLNQLGGT